MATAEKLGPRAIDKSKLLLHDVAELLPAMTADERARLKASIAKHGVKVPIEVWPAPNGIDYVIDGRHRFEIAMELGIDFAVTIFTGTEADLVPHVVSLNGDRRHLSSSQLAALSVKVGLYLDRRQRTPKQRREEGGQGGAAEKGKRTVDMIAEAAGSNRKYVQDAIKIQGADPDLLDRVINNELTIPQALKKLEPEPAPEPKQDPGEPADVLGHEIPSHLQQVVDESAGFEKVISQLNGARRTLKELTEGPAGVYVDATAVEVDLKNLITELKAKQFFTVCPHCAGEPGGCKQCRKSGWMPRVVYDAQSEETKKDWGLPF